MYLSLLLKEKHCYFYLAENINQETLLDIYPGILSWWFNSFYFFKCALPLCITNSPILLHSNNNSNNIDYQSKSFAFYLLRFWYLFLVQTSQIEFFCPKRCFYEYFSFFLKMKFFGSFEALVGVSESKSHFYHIFKR